MKNTMWLTVQLTDFKNTDARTVLNAMHGNAELRESGRFSTFIIGPSEDVRTSMSQIPRLSIDHARINLSVRDCVRWTQPAPYELAGICRSRGYFDAIANINQLEKQSRIRRDFADQLRSTVQQLASMPVWDVRGAHGPKPLPERVRTNTMID